MALTEAQKRNAANNRRYWSEREAEQLKHNITEEAQYDREIKRIHQNMLDACQKEIESFYTKYARAEGISLAEAKKRVSKLDIAAYERKAAKYVKEKNFSEKANEEMRLYNATMKINRLEMLKANIGLETIAGHEELEKFMDDILKGRTMDELARQAGILGKTVLNNAAKADAIVNGSFHSGTFSDRIWQYQSLMREDLGRLLQQGLIQGKNARALTKDLQKYLIGENMQKMGGAAYCMQRLMRTELARVQTEAQKQSFVRNGFDMYEFIVNGGCCDICAGLSGKHFKVDKMMPGENAPPMHPHCRCSTAAYEDDEEYEAWLDYLDNGGTTAAYNELKATATQQANKLIEKAKQKDQTITEDLKYAVSKGSGHLEGLEYRIKSQKSLVRKLISKSLQKDISIEEYAEKATDVLRYTNVSTSKNLAKDYFKIVEILNRKGYNVVEVNNTFNSTGPYRGVNTLVADKTGYVFELQYHTPESIKVKEINHKLYEEQRLDSTSAARKEELNAQMIKNASSIPIPANIEKIE